MMNALGSRYPYRYRYRDLPYVIHHQFYFQSTDKLVDLGSIGSSIRIRTVTVTSTPYFCSTDK